MPSLYAITIPVFISNLRILSSLLTKAVAHAPSPAAQQALLETRLVADMYPLAYQIQRVSDTSKGFAQRVAGIEAVAMEDDEVTFDDLQKRIEKTIKVLEGVTEEMLVGKDDIEVILKTRKEELTFTGTSYALTFAIPNFYFHFVTAYDLLRHQGVPIGKGDYLGRV